MIRNLYRTGWVLMSLLIVLVVLTMLHYFGNDTAGYFQPEIYVDRIVVLRIHIAAAIIAALSGPLQFVSAFRNKFRMIHRNLGKTYIVSVLIGAVSGISIAMTALGGAVSQAGFTFLALFWIGTTVMAYHRIRNRDIAAHKRWMIRSFALTFAFVMLRIIFGTLQFGVGLDEVTAFQIVAWACWIPNLVVIEFVMRGGVFRKSQNA